MNKSDKQFKLQRQKPAFSRIENLHPYKLLTLGLILSSAIVFAFYLFSFLKLTHFDFKQIPPENFPKFFSASTLLLAISLIFSTKLMSDYQRDEIRALRIRLSLLLVSGLLFIIFQSLAWLEILNMSIYLNMQPFQNYLYLFSGLHLTHIIAGVVLTAYIFYRVTLVEGDPVKSIILLTNPFEKNLLEIFVAFWHYTVFLWMVIYLVLLLVY